MSKNKLVRKNLELSADFSSYLIEHPNTAKNMPSGTCVIFEVPSDKLFSRENLKLAEEMRQKGKKCYIATKERGNGWSLRPNR